MTDEVHEFDAEELAAAERLDADIMAVLAELPSGDDPAALSFAGQPSADADPVVPWLAASLRTTPSKSLRRRIAADVRRAQPPATRWSPLLPRLAAAAMAMILVYHAVSSFFLADWIAANLGEPYSPHATLEGGYATLAVAIAVGAGALRRKWLPVSVSAGVPLGVMLGAGGIAELGVFPMGAVFHLAEGVLAVVLFVTWYVWRYGSGRRREDGV